MRFASAEKVSEDFAKYLSHCQNGDPVVITHDDLPIAALVNITDPGQLPLLSKHVLPPTPPTLERMAIMPKPSSNISEETAINDAELLEFFQERIKSHFERVGQINPTATPDIRTEIPGRKVKKVIAYVRQRKGYLKLFVRVGKNAVTCPGFTYDAGNPDLGCYDLYPSDELPADFDAWLEKARTFTERM